MFFTRCRNATLRGPKGFKFPAFLTVNPYERPMASFLINTETNSDFDESVAILQHCLWNEVLTCRHLKQLSSAVVLQVFFAASEV